MKRSGRCLCGAVTFEAEVPDTHQHACHCTMCRKWGGPALATAVESVRYLSGEDNITVHVSSDWAERGFCTTCGTHLFYRIRDGSQTMMWTGAFDEPEAFALASEIFIDQKPDGYAFSGDHPRMTREEFLKSIGLA